MEVLHDELIVSRSTIKLYIVYTIPSPGPVLHNDSTTFLQKYASLVVDRQNGCQGPMGLGEMHVKRCNRLNWMLL